jgi:hypothetical protein
LVLLALLLVILLLAVLSLVSAALRLVILLLAAALLATERATDSVAALVDLVLDGQCPAWGQFPLKPFTWNSLSRRHSGSA